MLTNVGEDEIAFACNDGAGKIFAGDLIEFETIVIFEAEPDDGINLLTIIPCDDKIEKLRKRILSINILQKSSQSLLKFN